MTSTQVAFAILGWIYLLYLNNRTLRRSEISRLKDRLVDKIEKLEPSYIEESDRLPTSDPLLLEHFLATKTTHIELRIAQLNHYIGTNIVPVDKLLPLREFDTSEKDPSTLREIISDLIEQIEQCYDQHFVHRNFLARLWLTRKPEIFGAITALLIIVLGIETLKLIIP